MNEHAGPACALSVLIVGLFAVLLHDRDHPPSGKAPPAETIPHLKTEQIDPPKKLVAAGPVRVAHLDRPVSGSGAKVVQECSTIVPVSRVVQEKPAPSEPPPIPTPPPVESRSISAEKADPGRPRRIAPRSTFTAVLAGEKLVDVARRVYGTSASTVFLWKANRDQVAQIDSSLSSGTLLRTP